MTTADFNGLMIFRGGCLADGLKFGVIDVMPAVHMHMQGVCGGAIRGGQRKRVWCL